MFKQSIVLSILGMCLTATAQAQWSETTSNTVFVAPQLSQQDSKSVTRVGHAGGFHTLTYTANDHQEVNDIFNPNQFYQGLGFTSNAVINPTSSLLISTEVSRHEQHFSSVLGHDSWRFGVSAGQGEGYVKSTTAFTGIDPYFIHGGRDVDFNYVGANAGYQLDSGSTFYLGSAVVNASGLEDRQANYLGMARHNLSVSLMSFHRGTQFVGKGIDLEASIDRFNFGYRQLSRNNGAHSKTLSVSTPTTLMGDGRLGFAVESRNNPLDRNEDSIGFLLTFSGAWGGPKTSLNIEQSDQDADVSSAGINKMAVIGAAVVAGAVIASSGSSGGDDNEIISIPGQDDAAFEVLNRINPESVRLNREHGGWIYLNANGTYGYTQPKLGNVASVNLGDIAIPGGTRRAATYHTHGGPDPRFLNEEFSPQDLRSDIAIGVDGYLGTPAGFMKHHDVETGQIRTLRRIAN